MGTSCPCHHRCGGGVLLAVSSHSWSRYRRAGARAVGYLGGRCIVALAAGVGVEDLYLQAHGASSRFYLSQCRLGLMSLLGGAAPRGRRHWFVRPVIGRQVESLTDGYTQN